MSQLFGSKSRAKLQKKCYWLGLCIGIKNPQILFALIDGDN